MIGKNSQVLFEVRTQGWQMLIMWGTSDSFLDAFDLMRKF